jgi:hypothetical protein
MNDKIKKTKDILWELDNKYNQSVPDTQQNINEATEKIVKLFALTSASQHLELLLSFQKSEYFDLYEQGVLEYKNAIEKYLA